ncbi:DUF7510 family protein [Halorubrum vacuolatum]|uniref:Uncharacterized protein n=1 Tax=Halorubrum vacuolatum TaxID=63740 RepID=A0A238XAX5_HALVU|nr:hypothetical protein [Halorubrum vacuolatum]SNR55029.1 hypothetical protein SAMN06264855_11469 [Halorubrum vacuolatum]
MADSDIGTDIDIDTRITGDRTVIDVAGTRDLAVIVRSADAGERIYLPPEGFEEPIDPSPYRSPYQSAYARSDGEDTPYGEAADSTRGVITTADGFRILHNGSATEIDIYRDDD